MSTYLPHLLEAQRAIELLFDLSEATSWWERRSAARMPWSVYRRDRRWTPPLVREWPLAIAPARNPALAGTTGTLFLAEARSASLMNDIVGRLMVWAGDAEGIGQFGLFETDNRPDVVEAMFDAAERWLFEHVPGLQAVRGPVSLHPLHASGLLVDGFAAQPAAFLPYNPPYYPDLVAAVGYEPAQTWQAYALELPAFAPVSARHVASQSVRVTTPHEWPALAEAVANLYGEAEIGRSKRGASRAGVPGWPGAGFVRALLGDRVSWLGPEGRLALRGLRQRMLLAVAQEGGRPVGAALGVPDSSIALRRANGRLLPLGWLPYAWAVARTRRLRVFPAVVPVESQGQGLEVALYRALVAEAGRYGFTTAIVGPLRAADAPSAQAMAALGAGVVQTYQIYEKAY